MLTKEHGFISFKIIKSLFKLRVSLFLPLTDGDFYFVKTDKQLPTTLFGSQAESGSTKNRSDQYHYQTDLKLFIDYSQMTSLPQICRCKINAVRLVLAISIFQ